MEAKPAGMKWCAEHKQWEHIRIENDLHIAVSERHPYYKAHITAICAMIATAKCCNCGNAAEIVTDGQYTEFYCRSHWSQRSDEQEGLDWMERAQRDPLTEEEKKEFGIEESQ